jgi:hypothetical protein
MRQFDGYVSHQIFIDQDAPGHIIALANGEAVKVRTISVANTKIRDHSPAYATLGPPS